MGIVDFFFFFTVCLKELFERLISFIFFFFSTTRDWKKLTFYYFADAYINFNSLVTDLFKIYKTRIWMSAINPASFVTPTAGLQPPGNTPFGQDIHGDRRRGHEHRPFGGGGGGGGGFGPQFPESPGRDAVSAQGNGFRNPFMEQSYQPFAAAAAAAAATAGGTGRQGENNNNGNMALTGFGQSLQPQSDPFTSYSTSVAGGVNTLDPAFANFVGSSPGVVGGTSAASGRRAAAPPQGGDWLGQHFQGLSLGS